MTNLTTEEGIRVFLSDMLLSGALPAGLRLGEVELAQAFKVSRERVRKVLHRLGSERLIELVPNRGAFVASPTLAAARDIYSARRILESGLLMTLAETMTDAQLDELEHHLALEHKAAHRSDQALMVQLSGSFHVRLAEMAGNKFITRYMHELVSRTSMLVAFFERAAPACSLREHEEIVRALRQRDGAGAARAGATHLSLIETRLKIPESLPACEASLVELIVQRMRQLSAPDRQPGNTSDGDPRGPNRSRSVGTVRTVRSL